MDRESIYKFLDLSGDGWVDGQESQSIDYCIVVNGWMSGWQSIGCCSGELMSGLTGN